APDEIHDLIPRVVRDPTPGQSSQCLFLARHAPPSARPEPRPLSGSLLQVHNPLLVSGMVGWPFLLEGSSPGLEEFLLPAVKDRRLESPFTAQLRDGLRIQQVPPPRLVL